MILAGLAVIGRRIEITAGLDRARVACDGKTVADHERIWAWHQTISDLEHIAVAKLLRRERISCGRRQNPRSRSER